MFKGPKLTEEFDHQDQPEMQPIPPSLEQLQHQDRQYLYKTLGAIAAGVMLGVGGAAHWEGSNFFEAAYKSPVAFTVSNTGMAFIGYAIYNIKQAKVYWPVISYL